MSGDTIRVSYPAAAVNPWSLETAAEPYPALAGTTVTVEEVPLDPLSMSEDPRDARPVYTADRLSASLDYGYPIHSRCTVEVVTGPYAGRYEVEGNPAHHRNRFTGWESSTTVQLVRVKG